MTEQKLEVSLKCRNCTEMFPNMNQLREHVARNHPEVHEQAEQSFYNSNQKLHSPFGAVPKDYEWAPRANRNSDDEESRS